MELHNMGSSLCVYDKAFYEPFELLGRLLEGVGMTAPL